MADIEAANWRGSIAIFRHTDPVPKDIGDSVVAAGTTPSGYSGTWTVVACSETSCSVLMPTDPGPYVSGGTIT